MNSFCRVLILLLFSVNSFAEVTCIGNAKEYESLKEKLPLLFQTLPLKLGGESPGIFYDIFASIKISLMSEAIVLHTDSWQGPLGHYRDMAEVKNVCFDSNSKEMTISFKNNAKDFEAKYSNTSVTLPELTLKKITTAQEKTLLEKIYRKIPAKSQPKSEQPAQKEVN